jgi:hypothetical protein
MPAFDAHTIPRPFASTITLLCAVLTVLVLSPRTAFAVLPLGNEQDAWSDLLLPSASGVFDAAGLTMGTGSTPLSADLEIGSQFGPTSPGWHYGSTGTLGGTFSVGVGISRLHINSSGVVTDSDSIITVSYGGGSAGSVGTDYGTSTGRTLLRGTALEVLLDAAGADTLDILFSIAFGDLQDLPNTQAPLLPKFAPGNLGLIRITAPNLPSSWTSNFNFTATSLHVFGLVPEPGTCLLACLAGLFLSPARWRNRPSQ